MIKQDAESLYYLTSLPQWAGYISFKKERIARLHSELESCNEADVKKLQGKIEEIRRDLKLRDEVETFLSNAT